MLSKVKTFDLFSVFPLSLTVRFIEVNAIGLAHWYGFRNLDSSLLLVLWGLAWKNTNLW